MALLKIKGSDNYIVCFDDMKIISSNDKDNAVSFSDEFAKSFAEDNKEYVVVKEKE